MIPALRKVAQLNIKYRKQWGPIIDVCTGAPPDEVYGHGFHPFFRSVAHFTLRSWLKDYKLRFIALRIND